MLLLRITVFVKANAKIEKLLPISDTEFDVSVKEPAEKGKANRAVLKLLAKHFGRKAVLISGYNSKKKLVEIED